MSSACRGRRLDYIDNPDSGRCARILSDSSFLFPTSGSDSRTQADRTAEPRAIREAMAESRNSCRK